MGQKDFHDYRMEYMRSSTPKMVDALLFEVGNLPSLKRLQLRSKGGGEWRAGLRQSGHTWPLAPRLGTGVEYHDEGGGGSREMGSVAR